MKKFVLHYSHLASFSKCGESFKKKYIDRIPEAPSPGLIIGSAAHEVYELVLRRKMEQGDIMPLDACYAIAKEVFDKRWLEVHLNDKEKIAGDRETEAKSRKQVQQLIELFLREVAPTLDVIATEEPWKLELANSPFDLGGTWDVILKGDILLDFKNVAKSPGANAAHSDEQCSMYCLAYYIHHGVIPKYRRISLVKNKTPKVVIQETTRTLEDFSSLRRRIEQSWRAIDAGIFLPAAQDSWQCSKSYCSYAASGGCEFFRESSAAKVEEGDE